ncbi:PASTA domain-containing protein [Culicoidibacter larvae]|nr:PASTA domain-containing protein [Culicoidibacter larvae]
MSSFLNSFDNDNYDETRTSKKTSDKKKSEQNDAILDVADLDDKSKTDTKPKLRNNGKRSQRSVEQPEHDKRDGIEEVDTDYRKKKIIKYSAVGGSVVAVLLIGVLTFFLLNQVTVKSFVNTPINDAKTWALQNNINLETEYVYDKQYDENVITEQDIPADSNVQKGSTIKVKISKGADPEELIKIPDFSKMNTSQIEAWVAENKASNVKIVKQYDDKIANGTFMSMEYKDKSVTATTYKRKDILTVTVSKGKEVFEKNIAVPDFANKSKAEVEAWAKTNLIEMTYEEAGSDSIMEGMVISQSVKSGDKIAKKDKMTVTISKGKASVVPWFGDASSQTAADLGAKNDLQVSVRTEYSDSVAYGELIWQSVSSGTYLYGTDKKVEVVYSEGRPYMSLIGQKENSIAPYFFDFKSKGANITYSIKYVNSDQPKGTVVWTSKDSQYLGMNDHIEVHVAK